MRLPGCGFVEGSRQLIFCVTFSNLVHFVSLSVCLYSCAFVLSVRLQLSAMRPCSLKTPPSSLGWRRMRTLSSFAMATIWEHLGQWGTLEVSFGWRELDEGRGRVCLSAREEYYLWTFESQGWRKSILNHYYSEQFVCVRMLQT